MKRLLLVAFLLISAFAFTQEKQTFEERLKERLVINRNFYKSTLSIPNKIKSFILSDAELKSITPLTNSGKVLKFINSKPKWYKFKNRRNWRKKLSSFNI
jgi:hypothetical protein